ncbi:MAG: hypothetical protein U5R31_11110 [Acidimicrobiia bacterium]|nr:hypothetical protein [Acidimicrobiia bacterium]
MVLDLTGGDADVIALPDWATDSRLYEPGAAADAAEADDDDPLACANCGGEPRVDVLDLLNAVAHVECRSCGFRWNAPAGAFREPS